VRTLVAPDVHSKFPGLKHLAAQLRPASSNHPYYHITGNVVMDQVPNIEDEKQTHVTALSVI